MLAAAGAAAESRLKIAVASTVEDAGLAPLLRAEFAAVCACAVNMIVGSSAASLGLLARGDVPVAITHAPQLEAELLASLPGSKRTPFMRNTFVLAGPTADPATVRGLDLAAAFKRIAALRQPFISRADRSGTHLAEQAIWRQLAAERSDDWYIQASNTMGATLLMAEQLGAYTLTDSATLAFLRARSGLRLQALATDMPARGNTYSVLLGGRASGLARQFASWLRSAQANTVIASHTLADQSLFSPLP